MTQRQTKVIPERNVLILHIHVKVDTFGAYEDKADKIIDAVSKIVDKDSTLSITDTLLQYQPKGRIR